MSSAPQLRDWFDPPRYRRLADDLRGIEPAFDRRRFLEIVLDGLEERTLMQRLGQTAVAAREALPGRYRRQVEALRRLAPTIGHGFIGIFLSDFVARYGLDDFEWSLEALRFFTRYGSAEFAVRPFIEADQSRALAALEAWTADPDEHVRRLASEGCRPRLPWGRRLRTLIDDPSPLWPILEALRNDAALYVRKSVGNNLNDISRDHPGRLLERLAGWDFASPRTEWIARRGLRTLIKQGHPGALAVFGFRKDIRARAALTVSPVRLTLGGRLTCRAVIASASDAPQQLVVDYAIHYVKARGGTSRKVFKWAVIELPARGEIILEKNQVIRDFTTRRHHPGRHRVELQINGRCFAEAAFDLR